MRQTHVLLHDASRQRLERTESRLPQRALTRLFAKPYCYVVLVRPAEHVAVHESGRTAKHLPQLNARPYGQGSLKRFGMLRGNLSPRHISQSIRRCAPRRLEDSRHHARYVGSGTERMLSGWRTERPTSPQGQAHEPRAIVTQSVIIVSDPRARDRSLAVKPPAIQSSSSAAQETCACVRVLGSLPFRASSRPPRARPCRR
jgi:hypothetical protein